MKRSRKANSASWETVRELASALPEAEESTSYGTPAFKVRGKLFVRFHQSGEAVVILISIEEREALMKLNPETFYITDHYACWPYMLVRLSTVEPDDLRKLIEESWRRAAPKRLLAKQS
ncbi:MAG TPA: MmcQ/YjbR family DNA-binding protein [Blastocatellia bacterium]|nr:MmcQ/YjbR family DNA-binding protein [Blastocatellia bacterium]